MIDRIPFLPGGGARLGADGGGLVGDGARLLAGGARRARDLVEFEELVGVVVDPTVTDVLVLGGRGVWADRGNGASPVPGLLLDEHRTRELAGRLVELGG
ncbi:MAG: hypothetical protein INR72_18635, partial [Williamsia herbipolensis]|nr:hypothetical protein [Williamsia herbipolensis]